MKKLLAIAAIAGFASMATADDLLAWWNMNNNANDNDLLNANGDGGSSPTNQFRFMIDGNPPFDDGYYDQVSGDMYPVYDAFTINPGLLVDSAAWDDAGTPAAGLFKAAINVNGLVGDNFTSSSTDNWGSFSGTSTNRADGGTFGGGSLSIVGTVNNGAFFDIVADLTGFDNINVSWVNRGTSTGFTSRTVSVSTDGVNFTNIYADAGALTSTWTLETASAGSLLDNASNAIIRFTVDGASGNSGNNRFDNIQLRGTPAPGALALLGLGGL
ncbi:MAG: hypothetical protein KDA21_05685, partial [Phycisphaerales bacterium]|nr:hypothetical protein [Phycisphaerales bacterium]